MALPTIDVVILSWNRTQTTLETIHNTLAQQDVAVQIYVLDQGSKEDQLTALRQLAAENKIHLIEHGKNVGPAVGRNIAMSQGTGDYIVGIDNDAEFEHEYTLRDAVARFQNDPQLGLAGFRIRNFYDGTDDMHSMATYPDAILNQRDEEARTARYVACGHMLRRDVLQQTRKYDETLFFTCEERDLAYQIINLGYDVIYYPTVVVRHKVSPEARSWWKGDRYYYLSRNAIYLDYKYYQNWRRTVVLFFGYIVRGVANNVTMQGLRGVFAALQKIRKMRPQDYVYLSDAAKQYLWEHDGQYRGKFFKRARRDLFRKLVPAHGKD